MKSKGGSVKSKGGSMRSKRGCLKSFFAGFTVFLVVVWGGSESVAQVNVGGLVDVELRWAGEDSNPGINQTPQPGTSLYTPYLRLFFDADLDDGWSVLAALQSDYYGRQDLSPLFFSMLAVQWQPWAGHSFFLSAGRLIIPFGSYSEHFLSSENGFRHLPLSHEWTLPVDKKLGFIPGQRSYTTFPGMTAVYNRMYTQGIGVEGFSGEADAFHYRLVWGMAAPSGFYDYAMFDMRALMGRFTWRPVVSTRIGASFGYGPYMKPSVQNDMMSNDELSEYNQTIVGADLEFSYRYLVLRGEVMWSKWQAPMLVMGQSSNSEPQNSANNWYLLTKDADFESMIYSIETIFRVRQIPGLSLVGRYDYATMNPPYISVADGVRLGLMETANYNDLHWWEFGVNYTLSRQVKLKATYMLPSKNGENLKAQTAGIALSVQF